MANYMDGGDALLEVFKRLGIDYIICSPGSEWAPLWEALARQKRDHVEGPGYIDCWHETLAVDMAIGYTLITGKPQAVLLHAGVGLLQGSRGIHGAQNLEVPMLVLSSESLAYGEDPKSDPGFHWFVHHGIVGGPQRLVEPIVKWAGHASSSETLYETLIRAAEMALRVPRGLTYLNLPVETLLDEWKPPAFIRDMPPAPKTLSPAEDIDKVAAMLIEAENPLITTETAGRDGDAFAVLVALAEQLALPVIEGQAICANFPKDHALYQGGDIQPFMEETDLALVVRSRAPWYPPSNRPPRAKVVAIDESPHRPHMVYQSLQADLYLEGDVANSLTRLGEAARAIGADGEKIEQRRARLEAMHQAQREADRQAEAGARDKHPIDPVWLCAALRDVMPADAIYIDEVATHRDLVRRHLSWNAPQSYFAVQGGLGQSLGTALGIKLARPGQPVVVLVGDGAFLYNPFGQSFGAAREYGLPLLIVVFNNRKYAAMQGLHLDAYPDGVAGETDVFHGVHIDGPDYAELVAPFGGYGQRVEDPARLTAALRAGLYAVNDGKVAILNVVLDH